MKEYYVLREIKKINEKGYSIEFCECYNSVDIKVYGHNRNIEKTIYLSGYGYYSENDYIYALQEIMVEIGSEEERDKKIKLKQWEYDTIKYHGKLSKFNDIHFLMAMKNKGYFKDMNSVEKCSMTIKDILDNCEVIGDD